MMENTSDADLHDVVVVGAAHVVEHGVELIIPAQPGVVAALCGVRVTAFTLFLLTPFRYRVFHICCIKIFAFIDSNFLVLLIKI